MTTLSASLKLAIAVSAVAIAVALASHGRPPPAPAEHAAPHNALDATADAEARQLRRATRRLASDLAEVTRCAAGGSMRRFVRCASPGLRHAGIGGRSNAMLVRGVVAGVPMGPCREYLFGLQAANDAASDEARWLYAQFFGGDLRRRDIAVEVARMVNTLERASRAAPPGVCAPGAGGPAA
jgi:hypothetical protein